MNENNSKVKCLAPIGLVLIASLLIFPFFKIGRMTVVSDWSFHANRVQQIYLNLKQGHFFTFIGTDTFHKVGNGNFLFYPSLFLYPWAFLQFVFKPVEAYYVYVWLIYVVTMLVSYYCMMSYSKGDIIQSIFFAIIYVIAPYHLYLTLQNYVLGEAQAYSFLPIVLLGMYNVLYKNKYLTLAIGMSLIAYCHFLSLFISVEVLTVLLIAWLIINKKELKRVLITLIKAVIVFALLTSFEYVSFITDYKGLYIPSSGLWNMQDLGNLVIRAINNKPSGGEIGLLLIITIFIGWKWIDDKSLDKFILACGTILFLMTSTAFPHRIFEQTIFNVIQFPYRYTSFAICFLGIVFAEGCKKYCVGRRKLLKLGTLTFLLIILYAGSTVDIYNRNANYDQSIRTLTQQEPSNRYETLYTTDNLININDNNYKSQFSYGILYGDVDYFPLKSINHYKNIFLHKAYIDGHAKIINPISQANCLKYKVNLSSNAVVNLPVLVFKHTRVRVNNVDLKHYEVSRRGTVQLKLKPGRNIIRVFYQPSCVYYYLFIIALCSWLLIFSKLTIKFKKWGGLS